MDYKQKLKTRLYTAITYISYADSSLYTREPLSGCI